MNKNTCFLCLTVNKQSFVNINENLPSIFTCITDSKVNSELHYMCLMCSNRLHECYHLRQLVQHTQTLTNMCQSGNSEMIRNKFEANTFLTKLSVSDPVNVSIAPSATAAAGRAPYEPADDWYQVDVQYFVENIGKQTIKKEQVSADEQRDETEDDAPLAVVAAKADHGHNKKAFVATKHQKSANAGNNNNYTSTKYTCDICPYVASRESTLNNHLLLHGNIKNTKYFVCKYCPYVSKQRANVLLHEMEHTGDKPYRCGECARAFARGDDFRRHSRTHTGDRPYRCDVCEKTFSRSCNFITHKRSHAGIRPYACHVCNKTFTRGNDLKRHRRIHICKKPFECDVCGQTFSRNSNLKIHQRWHTGERPYGCDACGQRFTQTYILKKHQSLCGRNVCQ